jgi:hypothetical protein
MSPELVLSSGSCIATPSRRDMNITNKHGVPETFMTLANKNSYSKGASQYSVTELMSPPKIKRLRDQYDSEIESDVADMLWSMMGTAVHNVLENGKTPGHITEERLFIDVDGVIVSGQIDLQHETAEGVLITDYKFTSAWAYMSNKLEWEQQLNVYKWLVETVKRKPVVGLSVCAMIRDFNNHDKRENYPAAPIQMLPIRMWDSVEAETYVRSRLDMHRNSKIHHSLGDFLQDCTDEERWMSETVYAVKRDGRKTAIKLFKDLNEAQERAIEEKGYVEERTGEPRRCAGNYCGVSKWCDQYQGELSGQNSGAFEA